MKKVLLFTMAVFMLLPFSYNYNIKADEGIEKVDGYFFGDTDVDINLIESIKEIFKVDNLSDIEDEDITKLTTLTSDVKDSRHSKFLPMVKNLDGIDKFKNITQIFIANSKQEAFSEDIFNLKSLVSFNFTNVKNLGGYIPDRFHELENLTTINLHKMGSSLKDPTILPDSLFESKTLTSLNLYESNVSGKVKIPNVKNIENFNIHKIYTNKIHTDLTEIELSPSTKKRFTFSHNHITDLTIDEFNHLEKLSKVNTNSYVLFDNQTKTYATQNYKYGDNVLLTDDSMLKTLFELSNSNPSRVDLSLTIKNNATNRFYSVDKDDYNLFITAEGIRLPENLLHIMKDNIDHVGGNSLIVTVNNTMLEKSKFTFPFNVDASMTREVNIVDSKTNEILKSLDDVSGSFGETITVELPSIDNYTPVSRLNTVDIPLNDSSAYEIKYEKHLSKNINIVDSVTKEVIEVLNPITALVGETVTIQLPEIAKYTPVSRVYELEVVVNDDENIVIEYEKHLDKNVYLIDSITKDVIKTLDPITALAGETITLQLPEISKYTPVSRVYEIEVIASDNEDIVIEYEKHLEKNVYIIDSITKEVIQSLDQITSLVGETVTIQIPDIIDYTPVSRAYDLEVFVSDNEDINIEYEKHIVKIVNIIDLNTMDILQSYEISGLKGDYVEFEYPIIDGYFPIDINDFIIIKIDDVSDYSIGYIKDFDEDLFPDATPDPDNPDYGLGSPGDGNTEDNDRDIDCEDLEDNDGNLGNNDSNNEITNPDFEDESDLYHDQNDNADIIDDSNDGNSRVDEDSGHLDSTIPTPDNGDHADSTNNNQNNSSGTIANNDSYTAAKNSSIEKDEGLVAVAVNAENSTEESLPETSVMNITHIYVMILISSIFIILFSRKKQLD